MTTATEELVVTVTPRNRANFRRLKTNSIQSVRRWEKENELLYAMMEDESEWLAKLFPDVVISPEFFFYALEDGSLLCRLANYIQEKAELYSQRHQIPVPGKKFRYHAMSKCGKEIKLFRSRENVQQFLTWCRSHDIPEAILFESNDVVQVDDYREGCRGVIICLMEIVRRTAKFELDELPQLIQMEKEIEEDEAQSDTELSIGQGQVLDVEKINMSEIENLVVQTDPPEIQSPSSLDSDSGVDSVFDQEEGDNTASRLREFSQEETEKTEIITTTVTRKQNLLKPKDQKSSPKKTKELPSLLESTGPKSELDKQICKLAQNYNIKLVHRLKEGKYIILGRIMFVRMLNDHMLVRIGGGWDTLEHYLMTHAPSKEALESPNTPSSQAVTSPRNSISASSGARTSLIEKIKRKEQVGVVNRDSPVYSSQGSLHQQLGNQSSPKIKDRGKKSSLTNKDEKDISEAIRKISTSVSKTLADRPASFTAKTFSFLKSRFDKGIFGTSRRTSSPDLTQKGSKIRRRLSDTTTMADVATTLAFDGEQVSVANNNDSGVKQPESGDTEETGVGKVSAPIGDLLGDEHLPTDISPPEHPASDETDSSVPVADLLSSELSGLKDFLGAQQNGNANLVDISSFDPFASIPDQGKLISIDTASPERPEREQPKSTDVVDNVELAHEEQLPEAVTETTVESSPPVDLGDLLQDTETKPDFESTVEASPRPIDLGDLLQDTQTNAEAEGTVEPSPACTSEETVALEEPVQETEAADVELVKPDEPVVNEDVPTSVQEVPPFVVDPTPETEPEPLKLEEEPVKDEEPAPSEKAVVEPPELTEPPTVEDESGKTEEPAPSQETEQPEPPKLEEEPVKDEEPAPSEEAVVEPLELSEPPKVEDESGKTEEPAPREDIEQPEPPKLEEEPVKDEEPVPSEEAVVEPQELSERPKVEEEFGETEDPTTGEETVVQQQEPPKLEEEPAKGEESPRDEAVIKSEGESTEAAPVLDETTTQEQSQAQQAAVVQVIESAPVKADESKEGAKPVDDQPPKAEKPAGKATKAKPTAAGAKEKSPPKPSSAAKKPTGAAKPTSTTKAPTAAPGKKDVKTPATKAPTTRPASAKAPGAKAPGAKAPAAKAPATKAPATKAPATKTAAAKTSASAAAGTKKPAAKPGETKVDGAKKPEKPKSAAATRPSTKTAARPASAVDKKVPTSTAKPAASKGPGKDAKDAGPPKSAPKATTTRTPSAKPAPKTTAPGTKQTSAKPTRTQSAKPADSTDGTGPSKKPAARPTSAKPKTTTTTTTVKKATTTTVTKGGTAAPAKTHTTTTKTVTQAKTGQPKTTTTTSTTTKATAKPSAPRPTSAAKKTADTKPAATGAKSKIGGKPSAGGKAAAKSAPKKMAEEPAKEKEVKQEKKPPVSQPEAATTTDEKPTEVVETKTDEKLTEKVETCSEEQPVDQLTELTPESAPAEQAPVPVEVSSDELVEESSIFTRVVTTKTTTIIQDGEEESTTTTEESTFEQGES